MKTLTFLLCFIMLLVFSGCMGTIFTRVQRPNPDKSWTGAYPFQAIALDCYGSYQMIQTGGSDKVSPGLGVTILLLSLPIDIVVDAVLLPVDLVAWPMGFEKNDLDQF